MNQVILVVHLLVALAIIGLILLQRGKGADMGASFGGGASPVSYTHLTLPTIQPV